MPLTKGRRSVVKDYLLRNSGGGDIWSTLSLLVKKPQVCTEMSARDRPFTSSKECPPGPRYTCLHILSNSTLSEHVYSGLLLVQSGIKEKLGVYIMKFYYPILLKGLLGGNTSAENQWFSLGYLRWSSSVCIVYHIIGLYCLQTIRLFRKPSRKDWPRRVSKWIHIFLAGDKIETVCKPLAHSFSSVLRLGSQLV